MRRILENAVHIPLSEAKNLALIDTCFFIDELGHHRGSEINDLAITSFNLEELLHIDKHLPDSTRHLIKHWLKKNNLLIVDIPAHPGDRESERLFVSSIDSNLLRIIPDASDAVLLAAAMAINSVVLTKDKHHLFTSALNNYLVSIHDYYKLKVRVFKSFKDYESWKRQYTRQ